MDASIEEASGELRVNFHENLGLVYVIVTNSLGKELYSEKVETNETLTLVIPLTIQEEGTLLIMDGQNNVNGSF